MPQLTKLTQSPFNNRQYGLIYCDFHLFKYFLCTVLVYIEQEDIVHWLVLQ